MNIKNKKLFVSMLVLLCAILTSAYVFLFVLSDDRQPPEIHIDSEILNVSVTANEKALLKGVTATDDVDGDVTSSILIEGFSKFTAKNTAYITYVAYDSAGNVSKATRTVKFRDYTPPVFGQTKALVFASNTAPDVLSFVSAIDKIDGDISDRVKGTLLSEATSLNYPGEHQIEFRVTNSMGDTQRITLPVEVYDAGTYNATVELSDYLVYVKQGGEFRPESYLQNLVVGTKEYPLVADWKAGTMVYVNRYVNPSINPTINIINVEMKSDVDTTTPGLYSVTYMVDLGGRYKGYTRLNVVVEG